MDIINNLNINKIEYNKYESIIIKKTVNDYINYMINVLDKDDDIDLKYICSKKKIKNELENKIIY